MNTPARWVRAVLLAAIFLPAGTAGAHQEMMFARLTADPPAPAAGRPFELLVELADAGHRPVAGEALSVRLFREGAQDEEPETVASLTESSGTGRYRAAIPPLSAGEYRLEIVELGSEGVESRATGPLSVGRDDRVELELVLPPASDNGLGAWLLWLVGLPLLAGLLVVLLVMTGRSGPASE